MRRAFLAVILAQAAHLVEEYAFRLYDVLAPARFVAGLFSSDLAIAAGGYFPGVGTAPLLLGTATYLAFTLTRPDHAEAGP